MAVEDFGKYALPFWAGALVDFCQRVPVNGVTKRLLFALRKPVLLLGGSPIDAGVKGARFRLYPRQNLSDKRLLCTPDQLDGVERRLLAEKLPPGSCLIDLGANIGGYCLLLAAARKDLRVVAVEADPELAQRLDDNLRFSGFADRVKALNLAVADRPGQLLLQRDSVNRGKNTVVAVSDVAGSPAETVEIDALPLLEILDQQGIVRPGAVKMDLEGFEYKVLSGFFAQAPKERWPVYLQLEQHRKEVFNPAVELALSQGYRLLKRTRMNVLLELA